MAQYIDKDALENILRGLWKEDDGKNSEHRICYNKALQDVQCEIDTLEVKEGNYERDLSKYVSNGIHRFFPNVDDDYCKMDSVTWQDYVIETAKHFFELGLFVNNPITAAGRGTIDEIILALNTLGEEKMISYDKEIEWLNKIKEE